MGITTDQLASYIINCNPQILSNIASLQAQAAANPSVAAGINTSIANIYESLYALAAAFASDGFADGYGSTTFGSLGSVTPNAVVYVAESGGTYSISSVVSAWPSISTSTFTATKNSGGNVTVSWSSSLFPAYTVPHVAFISSTGAGMIATSAASGSATVDMCNTTGAAANYPFVLQIN
jgi:hypothetical protein